MSALLEDFAPLKNTYDIIVHKERVAVLHKQLMSLRRLQDNTCMI